MKVTIPAMRLHEGFQSNAITVEIADTCPKPECGGPRGVDAEGKSTIKPGFSFDGRHRITVDTWTNPCGHVDTYQAVRNEVRRSRVDWTTSTIWDVRDKEVVLRDGSTMRVKLDESGWTIGSFERMDIWQACAVLNNARAIGALSIEREE